MSRDITSKLFKLKMKIFRADDDDYDDDGLDERETDMNVLHYFAGKQDRSSACQ